MSETGNGSLHLTIDGMPISVPAGTSIFDAARLNGIAIPTLCHQQNETPVGVCRLCVVEAGGRVLTAACVAPAADKMVVTTNSDKVKSARHTLIELLMADHPSPCARQQQSGDCELETFARLEGIVTSRFAKRLSPRGQDSSSFVIQVDHEACILCDRCIRGCDEIRHNFVLGRKGKGFSAGVAFDNNLPMGNSTCVSCGECMVSCPTGALTNKSTVQAVMPQGEPVEARTLLQLPYFHNVSGTFLDLNKHSVVERRFKKGEIICKEGDYGSTAFYIMEGTVDIFLSTPIAHVETKGGATGILSKLTSILKGRSEHHRPGEDDRRTIPIDAPVDLPYGNPIAALGPGDLFGEMTCMSFYPRSATVRASSDCVMLEMLRNVLDVIQRNKNMRAQLDQKYRQRALDDHLRSVPMFAPLSRDFIDELRERVELVRFSKGDVICHQGEIADSFYLVRIGFVKVTEEHRGGDLVLAYLGRGEFFGEIGLLGEGRRTATCSALDHVEVVRIQAEDFRHMMDRYPSIRHELEEVAQHRLEQNRSRLATTSSVPLDQFMAQGLMEAKSLLILDLERCTRCDNCVRACADAHDGVTRLIREGLRFENYLVATSCRHCRDPLCMVGCPVGAIHRKNSGEVVIENWCIGCGLCASNCPYGNINMHPFNVMEHDPAAPSRQVAKVKYKATSCDLCMEHEEPSCVYACPHDAAHRVDPTEFFRWLPQANTVQEASRRP